MAFLYDKEKMDLHDEMLSRLDNHRKKLNLSIRAFCRMGKLNRALYYDWKKRIRTPTLNVLQRLLDIEPKAPKVCYSGLIKKKSFDL